MLNLTGTHTLTPLGINLTRLTEKCSNTAINTAVDKAIPTSKSGCPESQPVSHATLALIKEKRRLGRQHSQAHDPLVKTGINQLQKEITPTISDLCTTQQMKLAVKTLDPCLLNK